MSSKLRRADVFVKRLQNLFEETLQGNLGGHAPWKAIHRLRRTGFRLTFEYAERWCSAPDALKRARAADILSQLGVYACGRLGSPYRDTQWIFREKSFELIAKMLGKEDDLLALYSEIMAFGHLNHPSAVPLIVRYGEHSNEDIRFAVAFALGSYHEDPAAIAVLKKLSDDADKDVRDWAIFGLGVLGDADGEEIRQIFLQRLDDSFLDARIEAAAALAKRQDLRVVNPLIRMLKRDGGLYGLMEAARELLQLKEDPEWETKEYIAALEKRFPD